MRKSIVDISPQKTARIAGLLYLMIIISGIFAEFIVRSSFIVPGNPAATASNIAASESLFRIGIASDLIMIICDVALALLFYVLLRAVSESLSLLAAFFRLIQAAILGANLLTLFVVLQMLNGTGYLSGFGAHQLNALAFIFLDIHSIGYSIGLVFFGINCLILGYLVFASGYFPRILGVLLIMASAGYLVDSFACVLLTNYGAYENIFNFVVFIPAFIGELSMCLWLLIKGVEADKIQLSQN